MSKGGSARFVSCLRWVNEVEWSMEKKVWVGKWDVISPCDVSVGVWVGVRFELYSIMPSAAVQYRCQMGHHHWCCSGRERTAEGEEKKWQLSEIRGSLLRQQENTQQRILNN